MRAFGKFGRGIVVAVGVCVGFAQPALAERRLAFVVGINKYPDLSDDAQLQRAVSDADSISKSLRKNNYQVTLLNKEDMVSQQSIMRSFSRFTKEIQPGDVVLFYFAGHGVGVDGVNYLVPGDIPNLEEMDEGYFRKRAITEGEIRDQITAAGARVTILMLDACRNNPFKTATRAISHSRGLEQVPSQAGVLTIYAAGYGQTALDRLSDSNDPSPNSVFTRVVLNELDKPGVNLVDFSEDVREEVAKLARSINHDQVPSVDNQLIGGRTIYLADLSPNLTPDTVPPSGSNPDELIWTVVQGTSDVAALRMFATNYPLSRHKAEAEARIAFLTRRQPAEPEPRDRQPSPDRVPPTPPEISSVKRPENNDSSSKATDDAALKLRQEDAAKAAETQRQADAAKAAAESKRQADAAAKAEMQRQADAAKASAEAKRQAEAAAKAEIQRQADAAKAAAETKRQADAAAKAAETQRQADAAKAAAESKRQADAAAKAEMQRQADAAKASAEAKRQAEAAAKAEIQRQADAAKVAAETKRQADAAAKAAEMQRQADAAKASAEAKRQADAAAKVEMLRQADAAKASAEAKRQADAAAKVEMQRQADAAKASAEAKRQADAATKAAAESLRQADAAKAAAEKQQQDADKAAAETQRQADSAKAAEAARQIDAAKAADQTKPQADAAQATEETRRQAEATKVANDKKRQAEAADKAVRLKRQADAARAAAESRRLAQAALFKEQQQRRQAEAANAAEAKRIASAKQDAAARAARLNAAADEKRSVARRQDLEHRATQARAVQDHGPVVARNNVFTRLPRTAAFPARAAAAPAPTQEISQGGSDFRGN